MWWLTGIRDHGFPSNDDPVATKVIIRQQIMTRRLGPAIRYVVRSAIDLIYDIDDELLHFLNDIDYSMRNGEGL
jgi:hypothetical protein